MDKHLRHVLDVQAQEGATLLKRAGWGAWRGRWAWCSRRPAQARRARSSCSPAATRRLTRRCTRRRRWWARPQVRFPFLLRLCSPAPRLRRQGVRTQGALVTLHVLLSHAWH